MIHWILLLITIVLTALANLMLKSAAIKSQEDNGGEKGVVANICEIFNSPSLMLGIFCLGVAVVAYAVALRSISLSVAYPIMTSSVIVLVTAWSVIFFGEPLTVVKVVGAVIIISGVVLLSY